MRFLLFLLLLVPASASALELRHEAVEKGCGKADVPAAIERWTAELGGPATKRAWRQLMQSGPGGCAAVAAWIVEGAPAASDAELAAAAQSLARAGSPDQVAAVAPLLAHSSNDVVAGAAFGLRSRLPVLDRPTAEHLVAATFRPWELRDDEPDPRASLLGLLLGRHAEGRVEYLQDGPVSVPEWVETRSWRADELPALHAEALGAALDSKLPELEQAFAELALALADEEHPAAPALGPNLAPLLLRDGSERATAQLAAQCLGRLQVAATDAAVDATLEQRNPPWLAPHLLNGFEDRLKAGPTDEATAARLERLRAVVPPRAARRADRLWKRAKKRL